MTYPEIEITCDTCEHEYVRQGEKYTLSTCRLNNEYGKVCTEWCIKQKLLIDAIIDFRVRKRIEEIRQQDQQYQPVQENGE